MECPLIACVLCVVSLSYGIRAAPAVIAEVDNSANQCAADAYCPGESFKNKQLLGSHFVQCDNVPQPTENCCLPQEKHFVCYNIMIDGHYLNFDQTTPTKTTDFFDLCSELVTSMGHTPGSYAKATLADNGGYIRYNYGEFKELDNPSSRHVKDLACGVEGTWHGKPLPRPAKKVKKSKKGKKGKKARTGSAAIPEE